MLKKIAIFLMILIITGIINPSQTQEKPDNNQAKLNEILKKTAEYCERLKQMALNFVCHENIKETIYSYNKENVYKKIADSSGFFWTTELKLKKSIKNSYIYDYQMVKRGEELTEKRILLNENGKEKHEKDAELKIERLTVKYLVYGPVGFLSSYWQKFFNYEILGQENIEGEKIVVIKASPTEPRDENYSFGKIWIDENDFSVSKIEWEPRSVKGFEDQVSSSAGTLKRNLSWTVFYHVEKNGIKFPSQQFIEETFMLETGSKHPKYEVSFIYDDYKFFTVETEVKYR